MTDLYTVLMVPTILTVATIADLVAQMNFPGATGIHALGFHAAAGGGLCRHRADLVAFDGMTVQDRAGGKWERVHDLHWVNVTA